jgi:hypothetical protein
VKKIFFLLSAVSLLTLTATKADAQVQSFKSQYGNVLDTVTNTTAKVFSLTSPINGYQKVVTIQFLATEISGTTAGSAQVQASMDNTNWYNIGTAFTLTDVATQTTSFTFNDWGHLYVRLLVTPTGTMSDQIKAWILPRKGN